MNRASIPAPRLDDRPEPAAGEPNLLRLDSNEGPPPPVELLDALRDVSLEDFRRYPDKTPLEAALAQRLGVAAERVLVDAGGDGTIAAFATAFLAPGQRFVHTAPTFGMIPGRATLRRAECLALPWVEGPFPTAAFSAAAAGQVAALVSPNNPTGGAATLDDILTVARACAPATLLLDLAYVEFAGDDPTAAALAEGNVVVLRTLSKALGLAGLRIGYAVGSEERIEAMRAVTPPYPASALSLRLAERALELGLPTGAAVASVCSRRDALRDRLRGRGLEVLESAANFVAVRSPFAVALAERLRADGVLVRSFPGRVDAQNLVRISAPGDEGELATLLAAVDAALENVQPTAEAAQ